MTEMLKQVQHDVLRLLAAFIKNVTLNLFQGLILNLSSAGRNEEVKGQRTNLEPET